ncbi:MULTISPECIES: (2Fe-2S) ferredoxin domain-containing protein [Actinomycetes]|jgi:(2Fe-2S) ferredoxin|uniref:(2Fe-2S) ferredoxin domain-containing protein n=1 Tax=Actinomycetes TaxID=1760 RepID=UPI00042064E0|nr:MULTISPECIES: (2Fe-2S) ferredoxin domain-containing protein [Actinomycetes]TWG96990.1 (2Fe-2S) ferredoxin [Nocardioides sp. J9]
MTVHVLVGTSPADAARRAELAALADELDAELAFLQLASPTLGDVLERLARSREAEVVLVGVSGGPGGPGVSWLRRVAADWWRAFGDGAPRVSTAPALMEETSQWRALVELARPITHGGPGLTSAAWEDVPEHRHQVFVCRGPRCTAAGAEPAWKGVVLGLMGAGLGDDDVLVTQTGCQFPCNHAPVVTVQPDDVWYGSVDEEAAGAIVSQHLVAGVPVERLRLPRRRKE